ncbi:nucleotidyltransferase family protein [Anaeromyxobacter oryzae]|uniref:Nucleotidyltransferase family protein n=1 Tax=Anaeromyxobacter oryzae TaxID=2918170 RepID=A0ABM7X1J9_9BACT|nr:nucleotidyltransferase family protein [Anaeromyxobacter oryzae]BDG05660.1 hypothetical protein AMOR_46560 [Anaeromyxobacter oryzae]
MECLLAVAGPRPALAGLAARAADVAPLRVLELARSFAVSETCAHALLAADALGRLGAAGAALRGDAENAAAKNTLLVAEAVRLQRALEEARIPSVALKGTALVAAHYPAIGARHVGDLDLLVPPADAARAAEVLQAAGCASDPYALPALDGRPAAPRPGHHHLAPLRTQGGISCELHVAVPGVRGRRADAEDVLARSVEVRWRGSALRVPSLDDLLGIACTHVLGAHRAEPRFVPRHVADVAVLIAAGADPGRAERLHPGPEVAESLALVAAARAGHAPMPGRAASVSARARSVAAAMAEARRGGELLRLFFPARPYLAARYRVAERSPWLPVLWAWRPLRAALRLVVGR